MTSYDEWLSSYYSYLEYMYNSIFLKYTDKLSFDEFCKFIYNNSSGIITPYI